MTSLSKGKKKGSERGDYGYARARYIVFEAVLALWRKRRAEGMKQSDIAEILNRNPGWVSRQLKGPGNWTLRTLGELVEALDGELEVEALPIELPAEPWRNDTPYSGYGSPPEPILTSAPQNSVSTKPVMISATRPFELA